MSVAIRLVYNKTSFLFVGDAEEPEEKDMASQNIKSTIYKVSHHGSYTGTTEAFLQKVAPKYAVISCGEGNSYGHPHSGVLDLLRKQKVKVFRTDEQGSIVATSDGKKITFNCSPSTTWQPGESTGHQESPSSGDNDKNVNNNSNDKNTGTSSYILNTNTNLFHYPTCRSVSQMSEKNKKSSNESRDKIISSGYRPCGNCKP